MTQHATLSPDRWARFTLDQQILMIANEMQRARALFAPADRAALQRTYERAMRLVDLTVAVQAKPTLRRELLRWRDLAAALYIAPAADPSAHHDALRSLLSLHPFAARQIQWLAPSQPSRP